MKIHLYLILFLLTAAGLCAQEGYPEPKLEANRLFYIQHSNSHNTFVYDANFIKPKQLHATEPIKIYRITYTKGGIREELSSIQRKMAYGIDILKKSSSMVEFKLVSYAAKSLTLKFKPDGTPYVTVIVNGKELILRKMFLSCNKIGTSVKTIDFYGKNIATGKEVCERLVVKE